LAKTGPAATRPMAATPITNAIRNLCFLGMSFPPLIVFIELKQYTLPHFGHTQNPLNCLEARIVLRIGQAYKSHFKTINPKIGFQDFSRCQPS
jgi:hypothetical protein